MIIVDDGSSDKTWNIVQSLTLNEPWIIGVRLARNYGHQIAVLAGLRRATKKLVAIIDIDLQDPPHLIYDMAKQVTGDIEIVYGKRKIRHGESFFKKNSAKYFYKLLNRITAFEIPVDTGDFRVITNRVADYVLKINDNRPFLRGYFAYSGYKSLAFNYDRNIRLAGSTKYTFRKMLQFALSAFLSFSVAPFNLALYLAGSAFGLSLIGSFAYLSLTQFNLTKFLLTCIFMAVFSLLSSILVFIFLLGKYLEGVHIISRKIPQYIEIDN